MNTFDLDRLMITEDSFGSDLPRNWEAVASRLNCEIFDRIATEGIEDPQEAYEIASSVWEDYCNSDEEEEEEKEMESKIWYAVQRDPEDDWGTGSYDYDEAMRMLNEQGYGLIAVIEETDADKVCIREIPYEEEDTMYDVQEFLITEDSFGSILPRNWEEVADYVNQKLVDAFEHEKPETYEDAKEIANEVWEEFCGHDTISRFDD